MREMFGEQISLGDAIFITLICMGAVFVVLLLISQILSLFKYIPSGDDKKIVNEKLVKKFNPNDIKDEKMRIAMLVASIEAAEENEGAYIKVRNIREI